MNNTKYSDDVEGDDGNFNQVTKFDKTSGYLGITQRETHGTFQRVLLTPRQVKKMLIFLKRK